MAKPIGDPHVSCARSQQEESIASYCFGAFNEEDRYRFEAHLLQCPCCWEEVRRLDSLIRSIHANPAATRAVNADIVGMIGISSRFPLPFAGHTRHALTVASLYGMMMLVTVFMETAYAYDRFAEFAWWAGPVAFLWSAAAVLLALFACTRIVRAGGSGCLAASFCVLLSTAAVNFGVLRPFFPSDPVTLASFQTWTAQAAYLKGVIYNTGFTAIHLLIPFAFVVTMQRELAGGRYRMASDILTGGKLAITPRGTPYVSVWVFGGLLVFGAAWSLFSTAHLLEALRPSPYRNLFINTIQIRWVLYLALGAECCWWYYAAINELKRECSTVLRLQGHGRLGHR